jgi:Family of unknown function (DUF6498)
VIIARVGQFMASIARHAVPVGGFFGLDWHPATAIGIYWLESLMLALTAACLCALLQRRTSPAAMKNAGILPKDVLGFHVGSLLAFGGFLGGVLAILIGNGRIPEPFRWSEFRDGAEAMAIVVAVGFLFDLWNINQFTVESARARVDACMTRWGLFWLVGFVGTLLMMFTGRPTIFFGVFATLKITTESWARIARAFGIGANPEATAAPSSSSTGRSSSTSRTKRDSARAGRARTALSSDRDSGRGK